MKKLFILAFALIAAPMYAEIAKVTTEAEIQNAIKSHPKVILLIHSLSCPHCKAYFSGIRSKKLDATDGIYFIELATNPLDDKRMDLVKKYMINGSGVPQTIVYENGTRMDGKSFAGNLIPKLSTTLKAIK